MIFEPSITDEELSEIKQRVSHLDSIVANSHYQGEPCTELCDATADALSDTYKLARLVKSEQERADHNARAVNENADMIVALREENQWLTKKLEAQERANALSRKSLCEQLDKYKAEVGYLKRSAP